MSQQLGENPYPGPRPFEKYDRPHFFGRDAESRELTSLIIAHRVVLLYAASGAGKTSLLNAAVAPVLEDEGFEVLRGRIGQMADQLPLSTASNAYALAFLSSLTKYLAEDSDTASVAGGSLAEFLEARKHGIDAQGFPLPRLLIFDQFEELLTLHSEFWTQRGAFVTQISEALEQDPLLRIVLSIREDYVAELGSYAPLLPGGFRIRFRLERLRREAALDAITCPLQETQRSFAPGVADLLVRDLLEQRIERRLLPERSEIGSSMSTAPRVLLPRLPQARPEVQLEKIEGEFVEPVQLQVVCRTLWDELPQDVTEIKQQDLHAFGNVDQVLRRLYDDAVQAAAKAGPVREHRLRVAIEEAFITPGGTRGSAYRDVSSTAGIPNSAIDVLDARRLLRAEERSGASWYELTHDRLIAPIRASNELYSSRRQHRLVRISLAAGVGSAAIALAVTLPLVLIAKRGGWHLEPTPKALKFGSVPIGQLKQKSVTLKNVEKHPVTLTKVSADSSNFLPNATCVPFPSILPPKAVCKIFVTFAPSATGVATSVLRIKGPRKGLKIELTITGSGISLKPATR